MKKELIIIGRNTTIDLIGHAEKIPAKIDTGADSSSIWVSNITMSTDGTLQFTLFAKDSPYYTGEVIKRESYKVAIVRSTTGHEQIRYRTEFSLRIGNRRIRALFNLSDRSRNQFPVLIGRRLLTGKYLVDVSKAEYHETISTSIKKPRGLNKQLTKDPYKFHQEQYSKEQESQ